ncbi:MAG: hypothetical protein WD096_07710 [Actinomycetota bacterium]
MVNPRRSALVCLAAGVATEAGGTLLEAVGYFSACYTWHGASCAHEPPVYFAILLGP